jgi:hypothetical protein
MATGPAVPPKANGGGHVHDSFDQFGLLDVRHGFVAALELVARQTIPRLQRKYRGGRWTTLLVVKIGMGHC